MSDFDTTSGEIAGLEGEIASHVLQRTALGTDYIMRGRLLRERAANVLPEFDVTHTWDPREVVLTAAIKGLISSGMRFWADHLENKGLEILPPEL